jgi:hypothetical protein
VDSTTSLLLSVLFSSLGMGYFIYGRRQKRGAALLSGVGLMVYPFFVHGALVMVAVGVGLCALPRFMDF